MKLSLFTPTHKPDYLVDAYSSLKLQTLTDWEWVILPNGKDVTIPEVIRKDPRVKLVTTGNNSHNIGALKRSACDATTGDILVEFDHDDLLVPGDSLQKIHDKFEAGVIILALTLSLIHHSMAGKIMRLKCMVIL